MPETYDYFLPEILKIFREGPFYLSAHFQSHLVTDGWGADADTLVVHFLGDYGGEVLPQIQSSIKRRWMESGESQRRRLIDLVSNLGVEARSLAPFFIRQIKDQSLGDIGPWEVEILLSKIGGAEAAAYFASLNSRSSRWPNAGHSQQSDIEIYRRTVNHIAVLEDSDSSPASKREALQYFAGDYRFKNAQFIVGPLSQIALDPSTPADLKSAAIRLIAGTRGKPFEIFFEQWIARFDGSKQDLELLDFLLNKEVDRRSS